jgi:hypothetical protein
VIIFEPNDADKYDEIINNIIIKYLKNINIFKGYEYKEFDYHPQKSISKYDLCVGYIIKPATEHPNSSTNINYNDTDILKISIDIVSKFEVLDNSVYSDIEFGFFQDIIKSIKINSKIAVGIAIFTTTLDLYYGYKHIYIRK